MSLATAQLENSLKTPDATVSNFKQFQTSFKFVKRPTIITERNGDVSFKTGDSLGGLIYGNRQSLPVNQELVINDNNTLSRAWTYED